MKAQPIRLVDVFVLGPFMIWAGTQLRNDTAKLVMIGSGIGTMLYNWENYRAIKDEQFTASPANGINRSGN